MEDLVVFLTTNRAATWFVRNVASRVDPIVFKATNGRYFSMGKATMPMVALTTVGARTGKPRAVHLARLDFEGVLDLLDSPTAMDLLGVGRLRELLYAILQGPAGPTLRRSIGGSSEQLGNVLTYMRDHLDQPLTIDRLAQRAGMSRAAFDRHFKATTMLSPLKYPEALRLNEAAIRIAKLLALARMNEQRWQAGEVAGQEP